MTARITFDGEKFRAAPWRGPRPAGGWSDAFQVFASDAPDAPAMMGAYALDGEVLVFTPRFAPAPGLTLRAAFHPGEGMRMKAVFAAAEPAPAGEPTRVAAIYPSADIWPANVLKFYVCFSAPMSIGDAWKRIRFRDADGAVVEGAFVEIDQELWDPEGRRLTVLFDPGRIKRGLKDHETQGAPFIEGRSYDLEIDADWKDARGRPLGAGVRRTLAVGPEARLPVDPTRWRVSAPRHAHDALRIDFPRPLDHALALRAIGVARDGADLTGTARLEAGETRYLFTPAAPWTPGAHEIVVEGVIEDLAGNRLGRLFDVDTADPGQARTGQSRMRVAFSVRDA